MQIVLPAEVRHIIATLEASGFEAYAVGGCVRDALLGSDPEDWDICTSALPEQTKACFAGHAVIETGLQHGTITLRMNHQSFEITTYRVDGPYRDSRRPEIVTFVRSLSEDLARRDFTMNALAYHPERGLVDLFGGREDIAHKTIRSVGNANTRFAEDALRIMRALRFASMLGFAIEESTATAALGNRKLLQNIAVERIAAELNKLLLGNAVEDTLLRYTAIVEAVLPEIHDMVGFNQNNPHHFLDVWQHSVRSVAEAPRDLQVRLALLLHDIGKPARYTEADGVGHFYGHPQASAECARQVLRRLRYDKETAAAVAELVLYHDVAIQPTHKHIRRWLNRLGVPRFRQLIEVKQADSKAQAQAFRGARKELYDRTLCVLEEVLEQEQCFSLKDLAVTGSDLLVLGVMEGRVIGRILNELLNKVIEGEVQNEREQLLELARLLKAEANCQAATQAGDSSRRAV